MLFGGEFEGPVELLAAVATAGVEQVAGHALGVDTDEHGLSHIEVFMNQCHMRRHIIGRSGVGEDVKISPISWQKSLYLSLHVSVLAN